MGCVLPADGWQPTVHTETGDGVETDPGVASCLLSALPEQLQNSALQAQQPSGSLWAPREPLPGLKGQTSGRFLIEVPASRQNPVLGFRLSMSRHGPRSAGPRNSAVRACRLVHVSGLPEAHQRPG
jgi:hypothetical protein